MIIDKHYARFIQAFLLVVPMSGIVTTINSIVAKGLGGVLSTVTLQRWGISFLVAYPAVLIIAPLASRLTQHLIRNQK